MGLQRFTSVESALAMLFGKGVKIAKRDRVSGGDINEAFGLTLTDGRRIFMKANRKENVSFFMAESAGLAAIAAAGAIGTPVVFGFGTDEEGAGSAFLLMEWIEGKRRVKDYWEIFARELAAMHRAESLALRTIIILGRASKSMKPVTAGSLFSANAGWNRSLRGLPIILKQEKGKRS